MVAAEHQRHVARPDYASDDARETIAKATHDLGDRLAGRLIREERFAPGRRQPARREVCVETGEAQPCGTVAAARLAGAEAARGADDLDPRAGRV
jgi:hypothetical protein